MNDLPVFGRRPSREPPREAVELTAVAGASPTPARVPVSGASIGSDLRTLCLARLDPSVVASMAPERLNIEVERLVAEIATEQRMELNAREQRRLSQDLV
ncbi:MAG: CpaF family protein, partial [Acetobacteraceae bacterium]